VRLCALVGCGDGAPPSAARPTPVDPPGSADASSPDAGNDAALEDASVRDAAPTAEPPPSAADAAAGQPRSPGHPAQADPGDEDDAGSAPPPTDDFFSSANSDEADTLALPSDGDLWVSCWSDDDRLYVASGDGAAFARTFADLAVSAITGLPNDPNDPLVGITLAVADQVSSIWASVSDYNRKPTGMLCEGGELFLAVQDLKTWTYDDAPNATIVRSNDKGVTWTWDKSAPMFSNNVFTTIMFLDYGKDGEHAIDEYVYAYGLDHNWAYNGRLGAPTGLYLARVPRGYVQDRSRYQFFTGFDAQSMPSWSDAIEARKPVLEDARRVYSVPIDPSLSPKDMTVLGQGSIVYNAPLKRYIYTSWTEYTWEFYEAPQPWGPWQLFFSKDFGAYPWHDTKNGGYATTIPSKFISPDGRDMYVQSNTWGNSNVRNYNFSLRKLHVVPFEPSPSVDNPHSSEALSSRPDAVAITRALRNGQVAILNDGVVTWQTDDSFTGDAKTYDYWGYLWDVPLHMNTLVYSNGDVTAHGGWFEDLTLQVRKGQEWVAVDGLVITPAYDFDATLPINASFTFRFADTVADGIRIAGRPGGDYHYTSIAELSVYYGE
jgi:hypothetical protein